MITMNSLNTICGYERIKNNIDELSNMENCAYKAKYFPLQRYNAQYLCEIQGLYTTEQLLDLYLDMNLSA